VPDKRVVVSSQWAVHRRQWAVRHKQLSTDHGGLSTGFTLIELLVALALISTIVTLVYGSVSAAGRSVELYRSRLASTDRACLVLRLLSRQLRCLYLPAMGTDPNHAADPNRSSPATVVSGSVPEPLESAGEGLSFVTTAGIDATLGLWRISYRCAPDTGTLALACAPYYAAGPLPQDQNWRPILTGVKSLTVEFYDGRQYKSSSSGGLDQRLPQAVRIALTVVDEKGRTHEFRTAVPLGCHSAPAPPQVAVPAAKVR
jgi:prepilin-type N-terminal cleavage/methylation domain-containing protein